MLTIILPTRNRAGLLSSALVSIAGQTLGFELFEVLVVDNGSTDETPQVLARFMGKLPNLKGMHVHEPGLHSGRHAGMLAAKGDILVFADDDIEALPGWLESIRESFADPDVAMVGGNNYPMFLETPPRWISNMWDKRGLRAYKAIPSLSVIEFVRERREISPYLIWGCNFAIRKDVLLAAGGFHPDSMPAELIRFRGDGETHVSQHVFESGMKCVFHSGASVKHKVTPERMTFEYFHQRGFNQGVSDSYTVLRNQGKPGPAGTGYLIHRGTAWAMRQLHSFMGGREVRQALAQLRTGHREGYAYHQKAYSEDIEVREWVHKPVYY